jgi:serine/threonine protein phosphatase 1
MKYNTYVIGDIHGGYRALIQLLHLVKFDYENDTLISLGDLADGWSETHLVIEELKKIKNLILLRGNHDEWALQALSTKYREEICIEDREAFNISEEFYTPSFFKLTGLGRAWYAHGGVGTEYSYANNQHLICDHIKFLSKAMIYYIDKENRFFSHAGPLPNIELEETSDSEFYWNRDFWYQAWGGLHPGRNYNEVYIGHTPTLNFKSNKDDNKKPLIRKNVYNMDTGACFNGRLSIMNVETKEVWQSDVVRELYPDERGRMNMSYSQESIKNNDNLS